jgi:hypothetical protein
VIHLERVALPEGLRALAYRDKRGNLVIYVSETLDAACQRAAVMEAVRASRRAGWRAGLPSAGIAVLLAIRTVLGRGAVALRARPLAWGAAATTAALGVSAAGVFITAVPHHHAPPESSRRPEPSSVLPLPPQGRQPSHAGHRVQARPVAASATSPAPGRPAAAGAPSPAPAPAPTSTAGSSPAPAPSPTPTAPAPSPSPSPSGGICVIVLGIRVCVPSVAVSAGG